MRSTYQDLVIAKGRHGSGVILCRLVICDALARELELRSRRKTRLTGPRGAVVAGERRKSIRHSPRVHVRLRHCLHIKSTTQINMIIRVDIKYADTGTGTDLMSSVILSAHARYRVSIMSRWQANSEAPIDRAQTTSLCQRSI